MRPLMKSWMRNPKRDSLCSKSKSRDAFWWIVRIFGKIMDIPGLLWYGVKKHQGGMAMKEMSTILILLMLLSSCGQNVSESPPTRIPAVSAEETMPYTETVPIITTATSAVKLTQGATSVSTPERAVTDTETETADAAVQATEAPQTAASAEPEEKQAVLPAAEVPVQQTVPQATTVAVTEPYTEPETNSTSDYEKAEAVYGYMRQNGYGTCVNFACQTYEKCCENGLDCCMVWTDAGIYGHVANIVKVDGEWYVLDTEGGAFLDYNYGFTEVVDIDGNHIADGSIISDHSYAESH